MWLSTPSLPSSLQGRGRTLWRWLPISAARWGRAAALPHAPRPKDAKKVSLSLLSVAKEQDWVSSIRILGRRAAQSCTLKPCVYVVELLRLSPWIPFQLCWRKKEKEGINVFMGDRDLSLSLSAPTKTNQSGAAAAQVKSSPSPNSSADPPLLP